MLGISFARFSVSNVYAYPLLSSRATVSFDVDAAVVLLIVVAAEVAAAEVVDHSYTSVDD